MPRHEFDRLIEELEELEDIRLYDEAKENDSGERINRGKKTSAIALQILTPIPAVSLLRSARCC